MMMKRLILALLAIAFSGIAASQPYPSKPVKVIIPYPPGSTPDIVGRTLSAKLQEALGQPFGGVGPARQCPRLGRVLNVHDQWIETRPLLGGEYACDGALVRGIGAEAVDGLGRKSDD